MKRSIIILVFGPLALLACSRGGVREQLPPHEEYEMAMKHFEKGDYLKTQAELQRVIYSYPGLAFIDSAQFYLGMSYLKIKSYPEAAGEFKRLLQAYPSSPLADDAQYNLAISHFEQSPNFAKDQTETYAAIDEFGVFLDRYGDSQLIGDARQKLDILYDKLAKKLYKAGELYMKLSDYEPALMYFEQVRDNYSNTQWAIKAFYYTGEAQLKLGRRSDALETFQNFVQAFPDDKLARKAQKHIAALAPAEASGG